MKTTKITATRLKPFTENAPEAVDSSTGVYGDLHVQHSKRTGLATGHTPTVIEGAKRIDWVRRFAAEHCMTSSRVIRQLVNAAIDAQMKSGGTK